MMPAITRTSTPLVITTTATSFTAIAASARGRTVAPDPVAATNGRSVQSRSRMWIQETGRTDCWFSGLPRGLCGFRSGRSLPVNPVKRRDRQDPKWLVSDRLGIVFGDSV
jgi:hypothetical protein